MDPPANRRGVRTSLPPGTRVGRYTIVERIGAGGMAELLLARQDGPRRFAKPIALKLLHAHFAEDPEFIAMFEREARIAAGLVHPHVVQVLDVGVVDGEHFLALEFVHGRDLRRILSTLRGPLPLGGAVRGVADVARALQYLHTRSDATGRSLGLVHRDVTPANILVGFAGSVKLADFGIAKAADQTAHTRTGTLKGKFGYMAPEQYMQEEVDARSDLYALGVVLYESTTGRRAFAGAQTFSIMNRVLAGDYAPPQSVVPDYPAALASLVTRMLAVDPALRPQTAQEVVDALEAYATEAGLDTGNSALGEFASGLFGHPEEPSLVTPASPSASSPSITADELATSETPSLRTPSRGRARMVGLLAIGGVGIAIGGVAGWGIARGDPSAAEIVGAPAPEPGPTSPETDASPSPSRASARPEARPAAPEPEAPEPQAPAAEDAEGAVAPAGTASPTEPAARAPAKRRRGKAQRRRKTGDRSPGDTTGLPDMFPKAMQ